MVLSQYETVSQSANNKGVINRTLKSLGTKIVTSRILVWWKALPVFKSKSLSVGFWSDGRLHLPNLPKPITKLQNSYKRPPAELLNARATEVIQIIFIIVIVINCAQLRILVLNIKVIDTVMCQLFYFN